MARKNTTARVAKKNSSNTMWGGRYKLGPAAIMEKINASIGFDRRLYAQDIAGSLAHSDMLVARGILGIFNFAPMPLIVPPAVSVVAVDLSVQLEHLAYKTQATQGGISFVG